MFPRAESLVHTSVTWDIVSVHSLRQSVYTDEAQVGRRKKDDLYHLSWGVTFNSDITPLTIDISTHE